MMMDERQKENRPPYERGACPVWEGRRKPRN